MGIRLPAREEDIVGREEFSSSVAPPYRRRRRRVGGPRRGERRGSDPRSCVVVVVSVASRAKEGSLSLASGVVFLSWEGEGEGESERGIIDGGRGAVAAAGGGAPRDLWAAGAAHLPDFRSTTHMAAAPALQPVPRFQQLSRVHFHPRRGLSRGYFNCFPLEDANGVSLLPDGGGRFLVVPSAKCCVISILSWFQCQRISVMNRKRGVVLAIRASNIP